MWEIQFQNFSDKRPLSNIYTLSYTHGYTLADLKQIWLNYVILLSTVLL